MLGRDLDTGRAVTVTTEQLCSGCYVLGVQGVGKSSLLEGVVRQLLDIGESVIVFDPHGQLIEDIVSRSARHAPERHDRACREADRSIPRCCTHVWLQLQARSHR
jgi:hypothetical protein